MTRASAKLVTIARSSSESSLIIAVMRAAVLSAGAARLVLGASSRSR